MLDMTLYTAQRGLKIIERAGVHRSGYAPGERFIEIPPRMKPRVRDSVLAHENGHHALGHRPTRDPILRAKQELAANRWAAELLISPEDFSAAESLRNGHVPSMAVDLHVADELVETYQRMLERLGGAVYVRPRMGVGQWRSKFAA